MAVVPTKLVNKVEKAISSKLPVFVRQGRPIKIVGNSSVFPRKAVHVSDLVSNDVPASITFQINYYHNRNAQTNYS
jgi:hypothetical protein